MATALVIVLILLLILLSTFLSPKRGPAEFPKTPKDEFVLKWIAAGLRYSGKTATFADSETACRLAIKELKLRADDLIRYPNGSKKLFYSHRMAPTAFEGGLGIRLTVQFNLFSGTIANLGTPKHIEFLNGVLERGEIGCFALTEARAGVLSGLIVETEAVFEKGVFVIHTPKPEFAKRWISNGLIADWAVVVARLIIREKDFGPHAFIVDMRVPGIKRTNMEPKVAFNGLDNALIEFSHVRVERTMLLAASVDSDGNYVPDPALAGPNGEPVGFIQVAQRLLSGRIALAGAALGIVRQVCVETEAYAEARLIPVGENLSIPLAQLPVFADTIANIKRRFCQLTRFVEHVETMYVEEKDLSAKLVELIAIAKISCGDFALQSIHELKKAVGSFSVQEESPFGSRLNAEALVYCIRFAEGDSAVLCQKIARDAVKNYARKWWLLIGDALRLPVVAMTNLLAGRLLYNKLRLALTMIVYGRGGGGGGSSSSSISVTPQQQKESRAKKQVYVWLHSHDLVNKIANTTCELAIQKYGAEKLL